MIAATFAGCRFLCRRCIDSLSLRFVAPWGFFGGFRYRASPTVTTVRVATLAPHGTRAQLPNLAARRSIMNTTLRRLSCAPTIAGLIVIGVVGAASLGCRSGGATSVASADPALVPLPPIEREVGPDGREVAVALASDEPQQPKSWKRKFADFCTPKPPPKSAANRVYESDSVPYGD
jgi:hypothetical protein